MRSRQKDVDEKRDWRISVTLGAVWFIALAIVHSSGIDIPASMLLVATVFFLLLIPAMNDLVRSIERISGGSPDTSEQKPGGKHE